MKNRILRFTVAGTTILSTLLWSIAPVGAVSVAADFTNNAVVSQNQLQRNSTNNLALDITLNNDVLVNAGADVSAANDALTAFAATNFFVDGASNDGVFATAEAIITDTTSNGFTADGTDMSAGEDIVRKVGAVDLTAFSATTAGTFYVIENDANDGAVTGGATPELIIRDSQDDGNLTPGVLDGGAGRDLVLKAGDPDITDDIALDADPIDDLMYFNEGAAGWSAGEDIVLDIDDDSTYSAGDVIIYNGGATTVVLTDALATFADGDNLMYLDSNHDENYDVGEPLIKTVADINNGGALTAAETVLTRLDGDGAWNLGGGSPEVDAIDLQGVATIGYMDNDHSADLDDFDATEAIIFEAALDTNLETTDTVLFSGTGDLTAFPDTDRYFDGVEGDGYDSADDIWREVDNDGNNDNFIDRITLNTVTVQNVGTAVANDITLTLWQDAAAAGFQGAGTDNNLGNLTADANGWFIDALGLALEATVQRIFVTVNIREAADSGRTINLRIPQLADAGGGGVYDAGDEGMFFDAAVTRGDGPSNAAITSAATHTIYVGAAAAANIDSTAPSAPTDVKVEGTGVSGELKVSWTNPTASDFASVRIYRSITSGILGALISSTTGTSYTDTGLTNGTTYYYVVESRDNSGNYSRATEANGVAGSAVPAATPTTPTTPTEPSTIPTTPVTPTVTAPTLKTLPYTAPTTVAEIQANLNTLLENLAALQAYQKALTTSSAFVPPAGSYKVNLSPGSTGDDVTALQNFLKSQGTDIYPEGLVTGYYGSLTQAAVGRFQIHNGVVTSSSDAGYGFVGPKTRTKINSILGL